jgi:hypothetical protein
VLVVNLDIAVVVSTVLGCLPKIVALRADITKELSCFDIRIVDDLELYATALSYCNAAYITASRSPDLLQPVAGEAFDLRKKLYADVTTLCLRGYISPDALKDYKGINGYWNEAQDLQILTKVLKDNWAEIKGRCATEMTEIVRGERLALRILRLVGLREQAPITIAVSADHRARAFTLFMRKYDDVRRAVGYLHWHAGDADKIAPSLYAGRRKKGSNTDMNQSAEQAASPAVTGTATTTDAAVTPAPNPAPMQTPPVIGPGKGLKTPVPGSNPFMD